VKDPDTLPINAVRRSDRAVTDEAWIKERLRSAPFGTLATVYDGQPFINPNIFVYDEADHALYMHTAWLGRTRTNIESDGRVCFSVSEMGRLLPADTALEFSVEYSSVVVFGHAHVIEDGVEAARALQKLLGKYAALHSARTTARFRMTSLSGPLSTASILSRGAASVRPFGMISLAHISGRQQMANS
jgi:nitroimidazol reductase NimA-like FMN-containing flavoprotein (pyridoxamine 5'-phosphate oxidase superfamily)